MHGHGQPATRSSFDNDECHVTAFQPISEAAHSWSYDIVYCMHLQHCSVAWSRWRIRYHCNRGVTVTIGDTRWQLSLLYFNASNRLNRLGLSTDFSRLTFSADRHDWPPTPRLRPHLRTVTAVRGQSARRSGRAVRADWPRAAVMVRRWGRNRGVGGQSRR